MCWPLISYPHTLHINNAHHACMHTFVLTTVFSICSNSWSCCCITCCCSCSRPWLSSSAVAAVSRARCCCWAVVLPASRASLQRTLMHRRFTSWKTGAVCGYNYTHIHDTSGHAFTCTEGVKRHHHNLCPQASRGHKSTCKQHAPCCHQKDATSRAHVVGHVPTAQASVLCCHMAWNSAPHVCAPHTCGTSNVHFAAAGRML